MDSASRQTNDDILSVESEAAQLRGEVRRWLWLLLSGTVLLVPLARIVYSSAWSDGVRIWIGFLLATPVYLLIGWPLLSSGLRRFQSRAHRGDLLLAAGVTVAYAAGLWQFSQFVRQSVEAPGAGPTVRGELFVDAMLMLTFIALGKYLQAVALERTIAPLRELIELPPENALCVREGRQMMIPAHQIEMGETILIRPGQRVPLDARVLSGSSQVDQSWLTGDARPVEIGPDAELFAGTLNGAGPLIARVTHTARRCAPQRVVAMLRRAAVKTSSMEQLTDRLATWLVPLVTLVTAAAFGWTLHDSGFHDALLVSSAVLLSASAGAVALCATTAVTVGSGRGALQGVFFAGGAATETATFLTTIALDKKTAITPGLPAVVELVTHAGVRPEELLATAAVAAQFGDDPLSACIVSEARHRGLRIPGARSHNRTPDQGVSARTLLGETVIGVDTWLVTLGVAITPLTGKLAAIKAAGHVAWAVAVGRRLFGAVATADVVAPYSRQAVGQLRALGLRVVLLSEDSLTVTAVAAREVTFDQVISDVAPDRKAEVVAQLRSSGARIALVSSSDEDAATFATADLSVALHVAGKVTPNHADIVLPGDLRSVAQAIILSRQISRTIRWNLALALGFNALLIPLAALGLPGVLAAASSAVAGVAVVTNSLWLSRRRLD